MTGPKVIEWNAESLAAAARGELDDAAELADKAADEGSLLGVALSTYLRSSKQHNVYDQPAAFEAFIAGGGNIDLYRRTSADPERRLPGGRSLARHRLRQRAGPGARSATVRHGAQPDRSGGTRQRITRALRRHPATDRPARRDHGLADGVDRIPGRRARPPTLGPRAVDLRAAIHRAGRAVSGPADPGPEGCSTDRRRFRCPGRKDGQQEASSLPGGQI